MSIKNCQFSLHLLIILFVFNLGACDQKSSIHGNLSSSPNSFTGASTSQQDAPITIYSASPNSQVITPGQRFDLKYHFSGGPEVNSWTVFVHFVDSTGKIVFQGDHTPPVLTSQWSGDITYFKTSTALSTLSTGIYNIVVGLYIGSARKTLLYGSGVQDLGDQSYKIGSLIVASPNGTTSEGGGISITDSLNHQWSLASGVISEDGKKAGTLSSATLLLYNDGTIYEKNSDGSWFSWNGGTWISVAGDPRALDLTTIPTGIIPSQMKALQMCVAIHPPLTDAKLELAQSVGINCVRTDLHWSTIESTQGTYNFSFYDPFLTLLANRNMKVIFTLDYGNPIYTNETSSLYPPITPSAITAWNNFVLASAKHLIGKNIIYEIWNEENGSFWLPLANASQYIPVLSGALTAIRSVNPTAIILSGGLSGVDLTYLGQFFSSSNIKTLGQGVGLHPYRQYAPETALTELQNAQTLLGDFQFWITEWGYSSSWYDQLNNGLTSDARTWQARMAIRQTLTSWISGSPVEVYYDLVDDGTDGTNDEDNFGLVDNSYNDKPAMTGFRNFYSQISGRTFSGIIKTNSTTLQVLRENGPKDSLFIVWLNNPGSTSTITVPSTATATDMYGNKITFTVNGKNLLYTLTETDGPIYIRVP